MLFQPNLMFASNVMSPKSGSPDRCFTRVCSDTAVKGFVALGPGLIFTSKKALTISIYNLCLQILYGSVSLVSTFTFDEAMQIFNRNRQMVQPSSSPPAGLGPRES
jgi:hypothetical protein